MFPHLELSAVLTCLALIACGQPNEAVDVTSIDLDSEHDELLADLPDVTDIDMQPCDASSIVIENLRAIESPHNVLAFTLLWDTTVAVPTRLHTVCGPDVDLWVEGSDTATSHEAFVMGLLAESNCEATAVASDGCAEVTESTTITTGPLPEFLPHIDLTVTATDRAQPGWTLINLTNGFDAQPYIIATVDLRGRYRWYHQRSTTQSGADTPVSTFRDGVLSGGRWVPLAYVDWLGNLVWEGHDTGTTHHEVRPAREDNRILFLQDAADGDSDIVGWDIETDVEVWRWSFGEHYTPPEITPDWSHLNSLAYFPNEDAIILSSRSQSAIYKVDLDSENIVWAMGFCGRVGEDGFRGDFAIAAEDRFYQQHDPELLANGNVLLFDNGLDGTREHSRAIEIAYDDSAGGMTAEVVWEYRHVPDIFAPIWGDADRLPNGNTLVTFGQRNTNASQPTTIVEVDGDGNPVWEIELPVGWGTYRSERMTEVPTGFVLSEPDG